MRKGSAKTCGGLGRRNRLAPFPRGCSVRPGWVLGVKPQGRAIIKAQAKSTGDWHSALDRVQHTDNAQVAAPPLIIGQAWVMQCDACSWARG